VTLLHRFPETLALLSLGPGSDVPAWAQSSSVLSITATATETSVLTAGRDVPRKVPGVRGLVAFVTADGPADPANPAAGDGADPGRPGLLVELLAPLAEAGISAQVTTTSTACWVLVGTGAADRAAELWAERGHVVEPAPTDPPAHHDSRRPR